MEFILGQNLKEKVIDDKVNTKTKSFAYRLLNNSIEEREDGRFNKTTKLVTTCFDEILWEDKDLLRTLKEYYYRLFDKNRHFYIICIPNILRRDIEFLEKLKVFLYNNTKMISQYWMGIPITLYKDKEFKEYLKKEVIKVLRKKKRCNLPLIILQDEDIIKEFGDLIITKEIRDKINRKREVSYGKR